MSDWNWYWGDLHNHNELGIGQGSLDRSYEVARSHLDFYAFTAHGQWHDGGQPDGLDIVSRNWPAIQKAAAQNNEPGTFSTFLAYEWHSHRYGHNCVYYAEDYQPLQFAKSLPELQDYTGTRDAILIPHHIAYMRGIDWEVFDERLSPVVEMFSEHGCSERDYGPYPMIGHSGRGRTWPFTAQYGLSQGKKFGFIASSDGHDGYPGAHGLGLVAVQAKANTRQAILEAFRSRRTIAVTGDRITVDLRAGEHPIGSDIDRSEAKELSFDVIGWDIISHAELIENGRPVYFATPDYSADDGKNLQLYRLRIEFGWGPMKGYEVFDWEGLLGVRDGEITQVQACFHADPFDEIRKKRITERGKDSCRWQSHTSRGGLFTTRSSSTPCSPTDAITLEISGTNQTRIDLEVTCGTRKSLFATLTDFKLSNAVDTQKASCTMGQLLTGGSGLMFNQLGTFVKMHRAVPPALYRVSRTYPLPDKTNRPSYYYLRVTQENGQMAWSSPIWIR